MVDKDSCSQVVDSSLVKVRVFALNVYCSCYCIEFFLFDHGNVNLMNQKLILLLLISYHFLYFLCIKLILHSSLPDHKVKNLKKTSCHLELKLNHFSFAFPHLFLVNFRLDFSCLPFMYSEIDS